MGIKDLIANIKRKREHYQEIDNDFQFNKKVHEKEKSSNERELERYYEEERQELIKQQLQIHRKKDQDEFWHGHSILKNNPNQMQNSGILKQKNIFAGGKGNILR